jgi:hypothetical protein
MIQNFLRDFLSWLLLVDSGVVKKNPLCCFICRLNLWTFMIGCEFCGGPGKGQLWSRMLMKFVCYAVF